MTAYAKYLEVFSLYQLKSDHYFISALSEKLEISKEAAFYVLHVSRKPFFCPEMIQAIINLSRSNSLMPDFVNGVLGRDYSWDNQTKNFIVNQKCAVYPDDMLRVGGAWLGAARDWMKWNFVNGSDVTFGSRQLLRGDIVAEDIDQLAATVACKVVNEYLSGKQDPFNLRR